MPHAQFYTTEKIGERQALTPEGFLLCSDVPIARTGEMIYGPNELPVEAGPDGLIKVIREESEVFRPEFMQSFNGKPIVDDHPATAVNPDNWKMLAGGIVLNPRRGDGLFSDCLIADLLVCNVDEISAVRSGKREVSCGYDADYEELAPGVARQMNMVGNHVALVDAGRCGPRCAIGDKKPRQEMTMATKDKKLSWIDRIRAAVQSKDEAAVAQAVDAAEEELKKTDDASGEGEGETHVHVHAGASDAAMEQRLSAVEDSIKSIAASVTSLDAKLKTRDEESEEEKKKREAAESKDAEAEKELEEEAGTKDARMAQDSAPLADSFQDAIAAAEILVPGIQIPTYDRAAKPTQTLDAICRLRRTALDLAYSMPEGRGIIDQIHGRVLALDGMSCSAVRTLFKATVAAKRAANNARTGDATQYTAAGAPVQGSVKSLADLNKLNSKRWG